jgi:serine/threonine protein kinase/tetratricopeptide (TPR) repeat protein
MSSEILPPEIGPGSVLGHFELIERIGSGGMGVVFKAKDFLLGRSLALKVLARDLLDNDTAKKRFLREGQLAASVAHPNIATVYEIGEAEGVFFIAMELVDGRNLKELIHDGPLSVAQVIAIGRQTCDALEAAHREGVIHRDVKSSNIMVMPDFKVKVLDFGLAKARALEPPPGGRVELDLTPPKNRRAFDSRATEPGVAVGTPSYMSPEQASGAVVDEKTDVFSLGVVLYEASTGKLPFRGTNQREILDAILSDDPLPVNRLQKQIPGEFSRILTKCLAKSPADRYTSVSELREELARLERPRFARRARLWLPIVATAAVVLYILVPPPTAPGPLSVAVIPLEYRGSDASRAFMGELVTDALIAGLQSFPEISTPPFETVDSFRKTSLGEKDVAEICRSLQVDALALGSVGIAGEEISIRLKLASNTGDTLWEKTVEGPLSRPLVPVEAMTDALVERLQSRSSPSELLASLRTPSESAYEKFLEAKTYYARWDLEEDLAEAISAFREAVSIDPDFAAAHAGLGRALVTLFYQTNEPALIAEATDAVANARRLEPDLPEVLLASGFLHEVTGEVTEAEADFARAMAVAPGYDTAYRVAASFYGDLGRHEDAERLYERALALRPGSWRIQYDAGRYQLVFRGNLKGARSHIEQAAALHPTGDAPKQVLGLIELKEGRLDAAEALFREVLRISPSDVTARYNIGYVEYYRGRFERARTSWQEAVDMAPERASYHAVVGDAQRQLGDEALAKVHYLRALELFRDLLELHPSDDEAAVELAALLANLGECSEAESTVEPILERSPDSFEFTTRGAYVFARCGSLEEAKPLALKSISRGDVARVKFDPDLAELRETPEVRAALQN